MTTDLKTIWVESALVDNPLIRVHAAPGLLRTKLSALGWLIVGQDTAKAHQEALGHAASLIRRSLPHHALWLLTGHTSWQPKSRVVAHRKLWGALAARGIPTPFGELVAEMGVETSNGIRYFGAVQLGFGALDASLEVVRAEPISHLVALRQSDSSVISDLVAHGWERPLTGPSTEVLAAVCAADGVVLWPVGEFDDREAGFVALAVPEVLAELRP